MMSPVSSDKFNLSLCTIEKTNYILVYKNKKIIGCYNLEKTNECII